MGRLATLLLTLTLTINPLTYRVTFPPWTELVGIVITIEGDKAVNPYWSYDFYPIDTDDQEVVEVPRHALPKGSYVVSASSMKWVDCEMVGVEYTSTVIHVP